MTKRSLVFALGLAAALTASQARAGSITGLFNTGVNAAGVPTAGPDIHYIMGAGSVDGTAGVDPFTYRNGNWAANTSTAQWITPKLPEPVNGAYNYDTTFTVTGALAGTKITGKLSADDEVVGVVLNGVAVSPAITTPDQGFGSLYSFTITSGFVSGTNTLEFLTMNTHEVVTGLIVEMVGTSAIPEPTSIALLGIGLSGFLAFRRFFKRASTA